MKTSFDYEVKTADVIIYLRDSLGFSARIDDFNVLIKLIRGEELLEN